jgi:alkylhydroperoxidase/carboxymuconolactone decarboxylase family protein YurZ
MSNANVEGPIDGPALKQAFLDSQGYWMGSLDEILRISPAYFMAYLELLKAPARSGGLSPKVRELIGIGINTSVTHIHEPAVRLHMEGALRHGASADEIAEVCKIVSALGTHTMSWGMPILVDELGKAGRELPSGPLSAEQEEVKAEFLKTRGFWKDHHEKILRLAPHYLKAYKDFSAHWSTSGLDPKIREFVIIACDVSTTHLYEVGTRIHIQNALRFGATAAELADVFVVTSLIGLQASNVGFALLAQVLAKGTKSPT